MHHHKSHSTTQHSTPVTRHTALHSSHSPHSTPLQSLATQHSTPVTRHTALHSSHSPHSTPLQSLATQHSTPVTRHTALHSSHSPHSTPLQSLTTQVFITVIFPIFTFRTTFSHGVWRFIKLNSIGKKHNIICQLLLVFGSN